MCRMWRTGGQEPRVERVCEPWCADCSHSPVPIINFNVRKVHSAALGPGWWEYVMLMRRLLSHLCVPNININVRKARSGRLWAVGGEGCWSWCAHCSVCHCRTLLGQPSVWARMYGLFLTFPWRTNRTTVVHIRQHFLSRKPGNSQSEQKTLG